MKAPKQATGPQPKRPHWTTAPDRVLGEIRQQLRLRRPDQAVEVAKRAGFYFPIADVPTTVRDEHERLFAEGGQSRLYAVEYRNAFATELRAEERALVLARRYETWAMNTSAEEERAAAEARAAEAQRSRFIEARAAELEAEAAEKAKAEARERAASEWGGAA